jgi:hypothetical protein
LIIKKGKEREPLTSKVQGIRTRFFNLVNKKIANYENYTSLTMCFLSICFSDVSIFKKMIDSLKNGKQVFLQQGNIRVVVLFSATFYNLGIKAIFFPTQSGIH